MRNRIYEFPALIEKNNLDRKALIYLPNKLLFFND